MMAKEQKPWPLVVMPMPDGRIFIRWFAGRQDAMKTIRRGGADDVIRIAGPDVVLEMSFHSSPEAAELALQSDVEIAALAAAPTRGSA